MTLGAFGHEEEVISNPLSPAVIKNIIYEKCQLQDEREAVVQQELVIHIGWIISNSPELFSGMLKIRVGSVKYLLHLLLTWRVNICASTEIVATLKKRFMCDDAAKFVRFSFTFLGSQLRNSVPVLGSQKTALKFANQKCKAEEGQYL